jgi:hypothetical protein
MPTASTTLYTRRLARKCGSHACSDRFRKSHLYPESKESLQLGERAVAAQAREVAAADVADLGTAAERHGDQQLVVQQLEGEADTVLAVVLLVSWNYPSLTARPHTGIRPTQQ